jgi:hypothetical protein
VKIFRELNPDWTINMYTPTVYFGEKTWTSFEQKQEYTGKNYFDRLSECNVNFIKIDFESIGGINNISEVIKSDYLRYYLLGNYGGCWSDMDIIFIKPIENVLAEHYVVVGDSSDINTVICHTTTFPIGFLMSSAHNNFYLDLAEKCRSHYNPNEYQCLGCNLIRKLYHNDPKNIKKTFPELNILVLNSASYLPIDWDKCHELFSTNVPNRIKKDTFGIHWFNGAPLAKKFQNELADNTCPKTGTVYGYIEKYIGLK